MKKSRTLDIFKEVKANLKVSLQSHFNATLKKAPAEYWMWDGIHPMPAGHELIKKGVDKNCWEKIEVY